MRVGAKAAATFILSLGGAIATGAEPASAPAAAAAAYQDRLIAAGELAALPTDADANDIDSSGLPRGWRVEAGVADTHYGDLDGRESGLAVSGFWDTMSWGSWSVDALLHSGNSGDGGNGSSVTVWQRQMPFADGWSADNGLGVVNAPLLPLMRSGYRFTLPTSVMAGIETDWRQQNGVEIQGAFGEPGFYQGSHWADFHATGGQLAQVGVQMPWSSTSSSSIAAIGEHDVAPWWLASGQQATTPGTAAHIDAQSLYAASAWQGENTQLQANLLAGSISGGSTRSGLWIDAQTVTERYQQHYGAFRLEPDLSWGALPFTSDIEGGYYRVDFQRAQWIWSAGLDEVRSISGNGVDGSYFNGAARYQARPWLAFGGDATLKPGSGSAYSGDVFVDWKTRFGSSRLQYQQAQDSESRQSRQVTWDQSLPTRENIHLSVSASFAAVDSAYGGTTRSASLATYGSYQLGDSVSIDGNVRWTRGDGPEGQHGFDGNLGLNWRFARAWSLSANYYESHAAQRSPFVIDPISQSTPFVTLPTSWAYSLLIRYEFRAGSPAAVPGGNAGGVGALAGAVFLDANGDGRRDAAEAGAPNITVILDGRYSVRTDASGRFDFSQIAAGEHRLKILPDNLPLPWQLDEKAANVVVVVKPRTDVRVDIAAKRSL
ncbi:MAG TPA: hypothetical protein VGC55_12700 [Dokdonella sp.]